MTLTLHIPEPLAGAIPLPEGERTQRLQTELACLMYAKQWLSFGQAAQVSGLDQHRFSLELADRNIPRHYSLEEVEHDLAYAS